MSGDPLALNYHCRGVPNKEFRFAFARPFLEGELNVGVNMLICHRLDWADHGEFRLGLCIRTGNVGFGPDGLVPGNPVNEVWGVRIPSYARVSITYRFGQEFSRTAGDGAFPTEWFCCHTVQ
jgi:hypothetical protein